MAFEKKVVEKKNGKCLMCTTFSFVIFKRKSGTCVCAMQFATLLPHEKKREKIIVIIIRYVSEEKITKGPIYIGRAVKLFFSLEKKRRKHDFYLFSLLNLAQKKRF